MSIFIDKFLKTDIIQNINFWYPFLLHHVYDFRPNCIELSLIITIIDYTPQMKCK